MKNIFLGGKFSDLCTIVDDEDFLYLSRFSWCFDRHGYAVTRVGRKNVYMHRMLLSTRDNEKVDHINHNTLDNRKTNIRIVNDQQSMSNRRAYSKSGYKGVRKRGKKWEAFVTYNKKQQYLGVFESPEDAAKAYDKEALDKYKEYACLNFGE